MSLLRTSTRLARVASRLTCRQWYSAGTPDPRYPPPPTQPAMMDLILVRHGESEGNVAFNRSKDGDHSLYNAEFIRRPSSLWRLTDKGREQAAIAGDWIKENVGTHFFRYCTSEYLRAMETAALLGLPDATWYADVGLRERDWGQIDVISQHDRAVKFSDEVTRRQRDSLFYAPPGGESLAQVVHRIETVLGNLNQQCNNQRVLIVNHGEVMWAFRLRLERLSQLQYRAMEAAASVEDRIHNGQILWYSRRDPFTGEISPLFSWVRSVCPHTPQFSSGKWRQILRPSYSNETLLIQAQSVNRIYRGDDHVVVKSAPPSQETSSLTEPDAESLVNVDRRPLRLKKVLLVTKTSRYQHECNTLSLRGDALKDWLQNHGFDANRLWASNQLHVRALAELQHGLARIGADTTVVSVENVHAGMLNDIDVVITAGGDGTFLRAASMITVDLPIIGVNTDPHRSAGRLCAFSIDSTLTQDTVDRVLDSLAQGQFSYDMKRRVRVCVNTDSGANSTYYALNEVFFAERHPARPSVYTISNDYNEEEIQRSSGVLVASGTGSTAWMKCASALYPDQVHSILKLAGHKHTAAQAADICEAINANSVYPAHSQFLQYLVREPITNGISGACVQRHGIAKEVKLRSLGWNMCLSIDGGDIVPVDKGVPISMSVTSSPGASLRTVSLKEVTVMPTEDTQF